MVAEQRQDQLGLLNIQNGNTVARAQTLSSSSLIPLPVMPADKAGKTSKKEQKKSKKTAATTPKSKKGESSTKILPASEKEDNIGVEIQEHPRVVEDPENDVQISSDDESEEDDVDEEGMEKLMAALGEDGLDEFAQAELRMLAGESDEEDDSDQGSDDDEGEEDEGDVSEAEEEGDSDENEEDDEVIPLDEAESVDEDIVPTQKVEIDNEVLSFYFSDSIGISHSALILRLLWNGYEKPSDLILPCHGQRPSRSHFQNQ